MSVYTLDDLLKAKEKMTGKNCKEDLDGFINYCTMFYAVNKQYELVDSIANSFEQFNITIKPSKKKSSETQELLEGWQEERDYEIKRLQAKLVIELCCKLTFIHADVQAKKDGEKLCKKDFVSEWCTAFFEDEDKDAIDNLIEECFIGGYGFGDYGKENSQARKLKSLLEYHRGNYFSIWLGGKLSKEGTIEKEWSLDLNEPEHLLKLLDEAHTVPVITKKEAVENVLSDTYIERLIVEAAADCKYFSLFLAPARRLITTSNAIDDKNTVGKFFKKRFRKNYVQLKNEIKEKLTLYDEVMEPVKYLWDLSSSYKEI